MGYEWFKQGSKGSLGRKTQFDGMDGEGMGMAAKDTRPATKKELIGFFEHLEKELDIAGFCGRQKSAPIWCVTCVICSTDCRQRNKMCEACVVLCPLCHEVLLVKKHKD